MRKKLKNIEYDIAAAFARSWNTLDASHFVKYLGSTTQHHSQWVFDAMVGREKITEYFTAKMATVKKSLLSGGRVTAELCQTRKGPHVFSFVRSPKSLAEANRLEETMRNGMDSYCVSLEQEWPGTKKSEALIIFDVTDGLLKSYCYCMPELYRHKRLGIMPGAA